MNSIQKITSALVIAASINTITPAPKAEAGVILTPVAVGFVLIALGIHYHNKLMIILDADGSLSQDALAQALGEKYSFIDNDDVLQNLASAIRAKAATTPEVDGKKTVRLNRGEVLSLVAPIGLGELNPAQVEQMIQDLQ
jgi:hypothetical protein